MGHPGTDLGIKKGSKEAGGSWEPLGQSLLAELPRQVNPSLCSYCYRCTCNNSYTGDGQGDGTRRGGR